MGRTSRETTAEIERNGSGRTEHVPLGGFEQKLNVKHKREGYTQRWINDDGDRIARAQKGGYEFVEDQAVKAERAGTNTESDARVSRTVGSKKNGHSLTAYLMEVPEEYYNKDQAAKLLKIDETEIAIKQGQHTRTGEQEYVPKDGINIKRA